MSQKQPLAQSNLYQLEPSGLSMRQRLLVRRDEYALEVALNTVPLDVYAISDVAVDHTSPRCRLLVLCCVHSKIPGSSEHTNTVLVSRFHCEIVAVPQQIFYI